MDVAEHITLAKDEQVAAALEKAAALHEPGTSEAELLRYVVHVGFENMPQPYVPPTQEQVERTIAFWTRLTLPQVRALLDRSDAPSEAHEPRSRSDAA